jgi:hypothetical protein
VTADDDAYGLVATSICQTLGSTDFGAAHDLQRRTLIEKCASAALVSRPGLAPDQKAYFTSLPLLSDSLLTGTDWSVRRSARVDALIATLQATTPNPLANDPQPSQSKTGAIAEVKAYVTTIDRQQHDEHEQQDAARAQIAARYCANATEAYLVAAYSRAPYNLPELRAKTKASGLPKEAQWRILGKVIYAMRLAGASVESN